MRRALNIALALLLIASGAQAQTVSQAVSMGGVLKEYISGFGIVAGGNNTSVSIAAGSATDSTSVTYISKSSACAVDLGTSGAGGLDTGAIAASTWYALYEIQGSSGTSCLGHATTAGAVPTVASLTFPSGYTLGRYVGRVKTDGSSHVLTTCPGANCYILPYNQLYIDTTSDTITWVNHGFTPSAVELVACGGGASGGTGGIETSGVAVNGGVGGAGGGCADITYPFSYLAGTLAVTVGAGGTQPAANTATAATAGAAGNDGNPTFFGGSAATAIAYGGKGCGGDGGRLNGTTGSGGAGGPAINTAGITLCTDGAAGAAGGAQTGGMAGVTTTAPSNGGATGFGTIAAGVTAGGAPNASSNTGALFSSPGGGTGGGISSGPGGRAGVAGGSNPSAAGGAGGNAGVNQPGTGGTAATFIGQPGSGGGGGGGDVTVNGTGGVGGAGAASAGGGGGGGTLTNGGSATAGRGAAGGNGFGFVTMRR